MENAERGLEIQASITWIKVDGGKAEGGDLHCEYGELQCLLEEEQDTLL